MPIIKLQGDSERRAGVYYEVDTDQPALGAGGMGQVYRGVRIDIKTGTRRDVAIKFLFDDLPPSAIERSRREANIHISNENLVEMFGFIEVPDPNTGSVHYHVVSELLQGVMLYDLLQGVTTDRDGNEVEFAARLYRQYQEDPRGFAIRVVKAVLSGVMAMHDRGYIHRDIDPSNIMVTTEGRIKLIDYGIAKNLGDTGQQQMVLTSTGQFMGKAAYAAPELVTGDVAHQNETTDIYAIGIMLFQLLTGHVPFDGANHEVLEMHLKGKMPLKEIKDLELRDIVNQATRKKQAERYITAAEFRVDLERVERGARTSAGKHTKFSVGEGKSHLTLYIIIGVVGLLALIGGGVAYFLPDNEDSAEVVITEDTSKTKTQTEQAKTVENDPLMQALNKLSSAATVGQAISELKKLSEKPGREGSEACVTLSCIYGYRENLSFAQKEAVEEAHFDENAAKSYSYAEQAYDCDAKNPDALFLMGWMYYIGPAGTGDALQRDLSKSIDYFKLAKKEAEREGNPIKSKCQTYIELISKALDNNAAQAPEDPGQAK